MTPARFAATAQEMAADFALTAEDLDAILPQVQRILGQIDQQGEALAQRQLARPIVTTDFRESERPHTEQGHRNAIRDDGALVTP